eukprot:6343046-Amphidinium_carterae.1
MIHLKHDLDHHTLQRFEHKLVGVVTKRGCRTTKKKTYEDRDEQVVHSLLSSNEQQDPQGNM